MRASPSGDQATTSVTRHPLLVLNGHGDGTFTRGATLPIHLFEGLAVGDVNHDGIVDVGIPDTFRNSVSVFLGRGDGSFAAPIVSTINRHPALPPTLTPQASIADFNGDGNPDLAISGGTDLMIHIMLGDGTGRFTTTESYPAKIARTFVVDDFNHDGRPDLAITQARGGTEVLLHK